MWPYPCIGQLTFLRLILAGHPAYAEVLSRLKSGHSFLDAGCCLGQDLRKLLFDGVPPSSPMYGLDIEPAFFDLGYELFRDRDKMHATFITADLTKESVPSIESFGSSMDIISANGLLHLFNLEDQKTVARHLVRLTKPRAGSMIIGLQIGSMEAGERQRKSADTSHYLHNLESFDSFWQDVGAATGSKWRVDAKAEKTPESAGNQSWSMPDTMVLVFTVKRE